MSSTVSPPIPIAIAITIKPGYLALKQKQSQDPARRQGLEMMVDIDMIR